MEHSDLAVPSVPETALDRQLAADMAELEALRAENARLKAHKQGRLGLKVSSKGAVSLYGLGRFPVTLYANQWQKVFGMSADVLSFIEANKGSLSFDKVS